MKVNLARFFIGSILAFGFLTGCSYHNSKPDFILNDCAVENGTEFITKANDVIKILGVGQKNYLIGIKLFYSDTDYTLREVNKFFINRAYHRFDCPKHLKN